MVFDFSRHLGNVLSVDREAARAVVQPGTVHATLQKQALANGLRYGPDPSSHSRCTIGGMIGNDACGNRALGYGKTSDNLLGLELVTAGGEVLRVRHGDERAQVLAGSPLLSGLDEIVGRHLSTIRTELGRFNRQVSGYAAQRLLPEQGFDVTRLMAGSEGTLGIVTEAEVALVTEPEHRILAVLGYPDISTAGAAAVAQLEFGPVAVEGIDRRIVEILTARRGPQAVPDLPLGDGWLLVELAGDDRAEVVARAEALCAASGAVEAKVVTDPAEAAMIWRVREDGAGLSGRSPRDRPAHAGWEDAAVPPERLGDYLRDFDELLLQHDLTGLPYGHFGDGCLHIRIDFPSRSQAAQRDSATSSTTPPSWSPPTAGRCRGSTATAARAAGCSTGCTPPTHSGCSPRSSGTSTPTTCSTRACWSSPPHPPPTCASRRRGRCARSWCWRTCTTGVTSARRCTGARASGAAAPTAPVRAA
ncbi:hypothetical protein GCM10025872_07410 [Barrientosiimonas endolithica]|uniref:FAD-binding PCMH-type domain-containing protein n=1 Tax=Barrientosiimonas endolithica TaxID=1535208 RepID=A0ABN6YJD9_9MICO|nr:hypothetical protein GCM10025872_07410 [Barrientosiimonas endolithica]